MNENELNDNSNKNVYRATTNLNVDMENPQIHINSAVDMNIRNTDNGNSYDSSYSHNYGGSFDNRGDFYKDYSDNTGGQIGLNSNYQPNLNQGNDHTYLTDQNYSNRLSNASLNSVNSTFTNVDYEVSNNKINQADSSIISNANVTNNFIPNQVSSPENIESYVSNNTESNIEYQPTMEEKKEKRNFQIPNEVKVMGFIVFILMIFLLLMPYIYDFFKGLQLALSR